MPETPSGASATRRPCPLCGRDNGDRPPADGSAGPWLLRTCAECAFVYLETPVTYEALDGDFSWRKTSRAKRKPGGPDSPSVREAVRGVNHGLQGIRRWMVRFLLGGEKVVRMVCRAVPAGRVLDVGCGRGRTLRRLPERYTPFGLEIDADYARDVDRACRLRGGLAVHGCAQEGLRAFADGQFACVLMQSYLEHEVRPREVLSAVVRVLQPGGCLIIKVPNYASLGRRLMGRRWSGYRLPDHVNYFTPDSLRRLVTAVGLEVAGSRFWDRWPLRESVWTMARRPPAGGC